MKFAIISGSHRNASQSIKVARHVEGVVRARPGAAEDDVYLLDLGGNPLPLWDEDMWNAPEKHEPHWGPASRELASSDAIVVVAPEWNGMVPPGLKNVFLFCGAGQLAHKPGLIVTVSASKGGAYPVAELRASSYKNTFLCYIPDHVIVRNVGSVLNPGAPASDEDRYVRERLAYAVDVLAVYAEALARVRASGVIDRKRYPFGM